MTAPVRCLVIAAAVFVLTLSCVGVNCATGGRNPARPATAQKPVALNAKVSHSFYLIVCDGFETHLSLFG